MFVIVPVTKGYEVSIHRREKANDYFSTLLANDQIPLAKIKSIHTTIKDESLW